MTELSGLRSTAASQAWLTASGCLPESGIYMIPTPTNNRTQSAYMLKNDVFEKKAWFLEGKQKPGFAGFIRVSYVFYGFARVCCGFWTRGNWNQVFATNAETSASFKITCFWAALGVQIYIYIYIWHPVLPQFLSICPIKERRNPTKTFLWPAARVSQKHVFQGFPSVYIVVSLT